jgi:S1-C subfamily serine protease
VEAGRRAWYAQKVLRFWLRLLASLAVIFVAFRARAESLELPELAARIKPSVVHLSVFVGEDKIGTGTGFFVSDRRIVTNHHVIAQGTRVTAKLSDGREIEAEGLLASDADRDLAILLVSGDDLPDPLPLGESTSLRQGDSVVVIGSPRGLSGTLSTGIVSAIRGEGLEGEDERAVGTRSWAIQITAAISPGSSGSPIFTRTEGAVVAVAVGHVGEIGNLAFGIPIEHAKAMLAELPPDATPKSFGAVDSSDLARNLLISAIFFAGVILAFFVPGWIGRRRAKRR